MFPIIRMAKDVIVAARQAPLDNLTDTHVSHHICWPHDLDIWMELNNGRALSLYDLGRTAMAQRAGLITLLRQNKWAITIAGSSTRFRRRIRMFEKFEMRSRTLCWDGKFIYLEQSMWKKNGECASHVLYRSAVTDRNGLIPPEKVLQAMGRQQASPEVPGWVAEWIRADAHRPWPPMQDAAPSPAAAGPLSA